MNFRLDERIPVEPLCGLLSKVVAFLQDQSSVARLNRFADWWQHDGLHFSDGTISGAELARIVSQPQRLRKAMPGDFDVRVGIQPSSAEWYLRFYVDPEDNDPAPEGDFDVTLPPRLADDFRHRVAADSAFPIIEESAASYYRRIIE
jgi:hypothetical protein